MQKLALIVLLTLCSVAANHAEDLLANLKTGHPRLLVDRNTWQEIQEHRTKDPGLDRFLNKLVSDGYATLNLPPLTYEKEGRRLLSVSRAAFQRVVLWSFDYRITGDLRFLRRADDEMLAVAAFPDWNPGHFLDTAEMTAALSLGYDWLYDVLPPASQEIIEKAIVEKGLRPGLDPKFTSWYQVQNNWNQVCFSGMTLGSLAVAEDEPNLAGRLLERARANIHNGLTPYRPDGVYPEGPTYWGYGTTYQVLMIAALETALGTDWNLCQSPGFLSSADYMLEMTGPARLFFNYSDGEATNEYALQAALFWMARKLDQPGILYFEQDKLKTFETETNVDVSMQFASLAALWWPKEKSFLAPSLPLDWYGRGINPVAVFRDSWTDSNAIYLAVKGGTASASHGHMDAGSFVLDAGGVRWAEDLGKQDYDSLESKGLGIWGMNQNSDRWKVFRFNNFSHNTLTINGRLHNAEGFAPIIAFSTNAATTSAVIDLSKIFKGQAGKVTREFQWLSNDRIAVIDSLKGLKPGDEVRWAMVTSAAAQVEGRNLVLDEDGKQLGLSVVAPEDCTLSVIPAKGSHSYDAPNPNARIVVVSAKAPPSGSLHITILFDIRLAL